MLTVVSVRVARLPDQCAADDVDARSDERRGRERIILAAVAERLRRPEALRHVFERAEAEIRRPCTSVPEMLASKVAQLDEVQRRLARFIDFIAHGKVTDSHALADAVTKTETSVDVLTEEVAALRRSRASVFRVPSLEWIEKRVSALRDVLERRTEASALLLRKLLGQVVLEPVYPVGGRPYYVARTSLDVLVLVDAPEAGPGPDSGANVVGWWRRRESNPRPRVRLRGTLHACPPLNVSLPVSKDGGNRRKPAPKSLAGACRRHARRPAH